MKLLAWMESLLERVPVLGRGGARRALLPRVARSLHGAVAGHGRLLCWNGANAWAWSPDGPWIALPPAGAPIQEAHVAADGILVVLRNGRSAGLWRPADSRWAWWFAPKGHRTAAGLEWLVDGAFAVVRRSSGSSPEFTMTSFRSGIPQKRELCLRTWWTLYRFGERGFRRLRSFSLKGEGPALHLRDCSPAPLELHCRNRLVRVPLDGGTPYFDGTPELLDAVPGGPPGRDRLLAALDGPDGPVAVATTAGVATREAASGPGIAPGPPAAPHARP